MIQFFAKLYGDYYRRQPKMDSINKKLNDADRPNTHGATTETYPQTAKDKSDRFR